MNGHQEAQEIDRKINDLINQHPIDSNNAMEWWRFARSLQTGLTLIENKIKDKLDLRTEDIASKNSGNMRGYPKTGD